MERREREEQRLREQREFRILQAQYGMDNQGNFKEQSITNMQRAVYAGEMSVADYYNRQVELCIAERDGVDDGHSCTKGFSKFFCSGFVIIVVLKCILATIHLYSKNH